MSVKIICPKCSGNMRLIHPHWVDPQAQCKDESCDNHQLKLRISEVKGESGFELREAPHG